MRDRVVRDLGAKGCRQGLYAALQSIGVAWTTARLARPESHQGTPVYVRTNMDVEQQSNHNRVTPFGTEEWDSGAGSPPLFDALVRNGRGVGIH